MALYLAEFYEKVRELRRDSYSLKSDKSLNIVEFPCFIHLLHDRNNLKIKKENTVITHSPYFARASVS
jgi:hypothetical protein